MATHDGNPPDRVTAGSPEAGRKNEGDREAPVGELSLKVLLKREHKKLGIRKKRRRVLGLTRKNVKRVYLELKAEGHLEGLTLSQNADLLLGRLRFEQLEAMDVQVAIDPEFWTRLLAWLKFLLVLLMFI